MFIGRDSPRPELTLDIIGRDIGEKDAFFFQRGLADQAFAQLEGCFTPFASAVRVAGEQLELRLAVGVVHDIEDAVLRGDDRRQFGKNQFADRRAGLVGPEACA